MHFLGQAGFSSPRSSLQTLCSLLCSPKLSSFSITEVSAELSRSSDTKIKVAVGKELSKALKCRVARQGLVLSLHKHRVSRPRAGAASPAMALLPEGAAWAAPSLARGCHCNTGGEGQRNPKTRLCRLTQS